ncbi:hypothetical protein KHS38_02310 [Mucilaginibacter sp. Bleaf8]|uniref:hypothetical protein n=1 Tax=Mucilaginibacter sp. Bleaf8 TaxID=2834430 RepID=UPI001BD134D7|nr:hypothetical protein [Mucilaginibacter sp. Bleaf8]MBS7563226.1 hypothetical protein [Mucilaginibacter sp. Bleaf8]
MKKHILGLAFMAAIIGSVAAGCSSEKAASGSGDSTVVTDSAATTTTTDTSATRDTSAKTDTTKTNPPQK